MKVCVDAHAFGGYIHLGSGGDAASASRRRRAIAYIRISVLSDALPCSNSSSSITAVSRASRGWFVAMSLDADATVHGAFFARATDPRWADATALWARPDDDDAASLGIAVGTTGVDASSCRARPRPRQPPPRRCRRAQSHRGWPPPAPPASQPPPASRFGLPQPPASRFGPPPASPPPASLGLP